MTVKVSPKYQVVIPEAVRQSLNIRPGMEVSVIAKGNIAYIVPVQSLDEIQKSLNAGLSDTEKREIQKSLRDKKDRKV
jgi:AbrB family looped-hinge helix DNA binding protein